MARAPHVSTDEGHVPLAIQLVFLIPGSHITTIAAALFNPHTPPLTLHQFTTTAIHLHNPIPSTQPNIEHIHKAYAK
jgi:hypothetical protein